MDKERTDLQDRPGRLRRWLQVRWIGRDRVAFGYVSPRI